MEILRNTSFLCGHFSMNDWRAFADVIQKAGWQLSILNEEELTDCKNYYYSEFVDFIHHNPNVNAKKRKSALEGVVRYKKYFNKRISLKINDEKSVEVNVGSVDFYLSPFNIVIFTIAATMENVDYNDMSRALLTMRDLCHYSEEKAGEFVNEVIRPIYDIYAQAQDGKVESVQWNFNTLVDNGNKLKLFQINEIAETASLSYAKFDRMLYDMGCLMPLSEKEDDGNDLYYNKVMEAGRVAVFPDWRALALFDSYTIVSSQLPDFRRDIWTNDYYGMIFVYSLFCHAFLLQYDSHFRARNCDIKKLEADILLFERRYSYKRFSYNFLPLEISQALERALELQDGIDNLHNMVTQASAVYEKESDDKMNKVLTFLAVITICSTIWDLFSLLDAAFTFGDEGTGLLGFRIAVSLLVLIIIAVFFIFRKSHSKR